VKRTPVLPPEECFDALYGMKITKLSPDEMRAECPVRNAVKQPMGLVHGGVFASMAESMTSWGTGLGAPDDHMVMGQSNQTSFLRPITEGTIHAVATPRHRGRTTWVWEVEITDDEGRLCALVRMTIAIRPTRAAAPGGAG